MGRREAPPDDGLHEIRDGPFRMPGCRFAPSRLLAPTEKVKSMGVKKVLGSLAPIAFAAFFSISPAENAFALSKQATDFLLSISIDPASANVKLADQDGIIKTEYRGDPEEYSLESLAAAKKTNGVKCFIETRAFIRNLKADFSRTEKVGPGHPLYSCSYLLYLTVEERKLAAKKF